MAQFGKIVGSLKSSFLKNNKLKWIPFCHSQNTLKKLSNELNCKVSKSTIFIKLCYL